MASVLSQGSASAPAGLGDQVRDELLITAQPGLRAGRHDPSEITVDHAAKLLGTLARGGGVALGGFGRGHS
jgi:hypothetical protein